MSCIPPNSLLEKSCIMLYFKGKSEKIIFNKLFANIKIQYLTLVLLNKDATPTSNFQPIRLLDPDCCYKFAYLMANSADPDQLASSEAN